MNNAKKELVKIQELDDDQLEHVIGGISSDNTDELIIKLVHMKREGLIEPLDYLEVYDALQTQDDQKIHDAIAPKTGDENGAWTQFFFEFKQRIK